MYMLDGGMAPITVSWGGRGLLFFSVQFCIAKNKKQPERLHASGYPHAVLDASRHPQVGHAFFFLFPRCYGFFLCFLPDVLSEAQKGHSENLFFVFVFG